MEVGFKQKNKGYSFVEACHPQIQCILVTSGEVVLTVRRNDITVPPGGLIVLGRDSVFRLSCPNQGYEGIFAIDEHTQEPRCKREALAVTASQEAWVVGQMLSEELNAAHADGEAIRSHLGWLLFELALRCHHRYSRGEPAQQMSRLWARRLKLAIDSNLYSEKTIGELLAGWELGPRQLMRHFQQELGITPKQYQVQARLEQACRMLQTGGLSITSIAMELGFPSSQHFAAQFRQYRGCSPTGYREEAGRVTQQKPG